MHKDSVYVREILRAGARGYLLKDSPARRSGVGHPRGRVGRRAISARRSPTRCWTTTGKHVTNPIDLLTSREREVLQMLAEGKTNKEIAVVLNLSVYTVDAHRGRIMEKLNLHSINELVRFAVRNGLID